jgi:hypothetical protein
MPAQRTQNFWDETKQKFVSTPVPVIVEPIRRTSKHGNARGRFHKVDQEAFAWIKKELVATRGSIRIVSRRTTFSTTTVRYVGQADTLDEYIKIRNSHWDKSHRKTTHQYIEDPVLSLTSPLDEPLSRVLSSLEGMREELKALRSLPEIRDLLKELLEIWRTPEV